MAEPPDGPNVPVYIQAAIVALLQVLHGSPTVSSSSSLTHVHAWLWPHGLAVRSYMPLLLSWLCVLSCPGVVLCCHALTFHQCTAMCSTRYCAIELLCPAQTIVPALTCPGWIHVISPDTLFLVYTRAKLHHSTSLMLQRLVLFNFHVLTKSKELRAHTC